ncbi:hypothetical protein [Mycolicibacterium doricum]|uniref:hypothetical protein n=1 Tax=Mycolicibacterium doricum TaxID=126673 RepID=UPI001055AC38|nr:hypothetical protein [Mycolicibacterium doricum]MCV7267121.1 hypothetical protein [Mycolicibacterium doricum]
MPDRLAVDAAGLSAAATASVDIAQGLAANPSGSAAGSQPSHAGVAALDGSLAAARTRQARRVQGQGSDLRAAGAVYTRTDESAAEDVTRTI